jgi:hypothetical protein
MLKLGLTEPLAKMATDVQHANLLPISVMLSMLMYLALFLSGWLFLLIYGLSTLIFVIGVIKKERGPLRVIGSILLFLPIILFFVLLLNVIPFH